MGRVLVFAAASCGAHAQRVAPVTWSGQVESCPLFVRAAREVVFQRIGEHERVDVGGVIFNPGEPRTHEGATLRLAEEAEGRGLGIEGEHCAARGAVADRRALPSDEAAAYALRRQRIERSNVDLTLMEAATATGKNSDALDAARSACALRREAFQGDHALVSECEMHLAMRLLDGGKGDEALAQIRSTNASLIALAGGRKTLEMAGAKALEARFLFALGRTRELYPVARESFETRAQLLGAVHPLTVASQHYMALGLGAEGRIDEAVATMEEVVRVSTTLQGAEGIRTLRAKVDLSSLLQQRGDFDRVVVLQREIVEARRRSAGDANVLTISSVHNLGIALIEAGRMEEALPLVTRALPVAVESLGEGHVQTLRMKSLLAAIYSQFGRDEEALSLYLEVHDARRKVLGESNGSTANAAFYVGNLLLNLGRSEEALKVAEVSLAALQSAPDRAPTADRELTQLKADAMLRLGHARAALQALEALGVRAPTAELVRTADRNRLSAAITWVSAQAELGMRDVAIASMETIFVGFRERFGPRHSMTLDAMAQLADLLAQGGREADASRLLEEFVAINERMMDDGIASNSINRGRLAQGVRDRPYMAGYRTYVRLLAATDPAKAFAVAELTKGRSLNETLAKPRGTAAAAQAARQRFARAEERVADTEIGTALYLQAVSERALAEEDLRSAVGPAPKRRANTDFPATFRRVLPQDSVFLEYIVSGDRVVVLIADSRGTVTAHDLGAIRGLDETVEAFRRVTASSNPLSERVWGLEDGSVRWSLTRPQGGSRLSDPEEIGRRLSRQLLEPLARRIGSARAWVISPDGALGFLPFEALKWAGRAVVESKHVSYSASLTSLAITPARVSSGPRHEFLGVGISRFGESQGSRWSRLPRAEAETQSIARLFPGARVMTGSQATEANFRQLAQSGELRRYRIIHFATHAYLSSRGAGASGIVLADTKAGSTEGIITAAEWPTYRLGSDLVVLSACDTGLGTLVAGEGVVGLPTAILAAGSRAVILTLWSVADESAAEFMPRFYKRLKAGKSPGDALRETKLEFARSNGPWSSPRHWAPYVLYGAS